MNSDGIKTLIVEDEPISRKILERLLSRWGKVHFAEDGAGGLALALDAINQGDAFDLICLDVKMPHLEGREVLQKIREHEEKLNFSLAERAKIIMITGATDKETILGSFQDGAEGYLTKPLDVKKLRELLHKLDLHAPTKAKS